MLLFFQLFQLFIIGTQKQHWTPLTFIVYKQNTKKFFKILYFLFSRRKTVIQVCNNMKSKW